MIQIFGRAEFIDFDAMYRERKAAAAEKAPLNATRATTYGS